MEAAVEETTTTGDGGGDGDVGGPNDVINIVKGKRTKRQRPQSPIPFTISPNDNNNNDLSNSPVCSSGFPASSTNTEDEDTAKSLILLSRGQRVLSMRNKDDDEFSLYKFNSKKYIQTPANAATGKAGIYVYECKTCGRNFPSFQALGGHRASHKKPKNNEDTRKPPPYPAISDDNEPPPLQFPLFNNHSSSSSSLSLQLNNRVPLIGNTTKSSSRLHECSICGTEFNSGQALGGHMRRHRVVGGGNKGGNSTGTITGIAFTNTETTCLSLIPVNPVTTVEVYNQDDRKSNDDALCLGLDLNLPAPQEATASTVNHDQHQERSFTFSTTGENQKKQQPSIHLSAGPTLVDCHY